jgi:hypothetical protein
MFADEEHAEVFSKEFGGQPMHPSQRGKGKNWSQWKKAQISQNPKGLTISRIEYVRSRSFRGFRGEAATNEELLALLHPCPDDG